MRREMGGRQRASSTVNTVIQTSERRVFGGTCPGESQLRHGGRAGGRMGKTSVFSGGLRELGGRSMDVGACLERMCAERDQMSAAS